MIKSFKWTIPAKNLLSMGYKFQKLFARDYKVYSKEINNITIWLWVKDRQIEIEDWYGNTKDIIEYFKANYEQEKERKYLICYLTDNGDILPKPSIKNFSDLEEFFNWESASKRKIVIFIPKLMEVLKEINLLTYQSNVSKRSVA